MVESIGELQMKHFDDFDHQESADMTYGGQQEYCKALAGGPDLTDHSITGDWTADED